MSQENSRWGTLYISIVILLGLAVIARSLTVTAAVPPSLEWLILATLTLLSGSFTVRLPSLGARLSVSETFVFASALLFGPEAGTLTVVLDSLVILFWLNKSPRSAARVLFNVAAPALAFWLAAVTFFALAQSTPGSIEQGDLHGLVGPLFIFALLYFLVNTWLVAGALAWERQTSAWTIWLRNFAGLSINYFVGGSVAILLVAYTTRIDFTVLSIIIPLLLVSYYTFRSSMGRLEDANRYVVQLNDLYMSTIEALAMAVDAKDQITHGHIRRVQVYALELAKRLGVSDERQLKAIATAALLHDMGKLAIPEHILNKPGKLTPAEFEKMKRHADIGADLLSSVKFPYPVVPIVRHHHEHWNGTGYPAGISGTDIPLGARILSVVDCFDALTSDRPYRPRLTTAEAFKIIREGQGTAYDPLVVDAFISAYHEIAPAAARAGQEARSIIDTEVIIAANTEAQAPLRQIRASASEAAQLDSCARDISKAASTATALQAAARSVRQLTPATVCALFLYDNPSDLLTCVSTWGDKQKLVDGLTIKLGERITGWVAANRQSSINSNASLDLRQITSFFTPPLSSAISAPIADGGMLVGVITGYGIKENAFNENHQYIFEQVALMLFSRLSSLPSNVSSNVVSFPLQKN